MMRRNSYLGLREVEQTLMMTEACGATNCTMMEVGEVSGNLIMSVVIDVRRYIS